MSQSISVADYRAALTVQGVRAPVLMSLLARMPIAMISLALLLYVQRATGSFATAGAVSAGALLGVACGSVVQGRVMDHFGPSRPLWVMSAVFGVLVLAEIVAIEARAPEAVLVALAFGDGITEPTVGPASRALWGRLLPPGAVRDAGYSYEAISMEMFFVLGPGLAGMLVALPWPGTGLVIGTLCMIVGSVGFAGTRAVRGWRPEPGERPDGNPLGAIASPGMRTVALAALGMGIVVGFVEVAVPAAAAGAGYPTAGGLLLSLLSISSVLVGMVYGTRPCPRPMYLRMPVLLLGFGAVTCILVLPTTLVGLATVLLAVGSFITPQSTAHSMSIEVTAPAGTAAEAFGWVITAVTLGAAIGQSTSGSLVETLGPPTAFATGGAAGVAVAVLLWLRRRTLLPSRPRSDMELAGSSL